MQVTSCDKLIVSTKGKDDAAQDFPLLDLAQSGGDGQNSDRLGRYSDIAPNQPGDFCKHVLDLLWALCARISNIDAAESHVTVERLHG